MKDKMTVYERPTCSKCREMSKILKEHNIDFDKVNYYTDPLTAPKLQDLIKKMGISPRDLLRTSEPIYRELKLAKAELTDKELVDLMVKHPDLMQRPIVELGSKAILGRPTENIEKLLK